MKKTILKCKNNSETKKINNGSPTQYVKNNFNNGTKLDNNNKIACA